MNVKLGLIQKQQTTKSMHLKCGAMYRRMLRISWTCHTINIDVLQKIGVKETTKLLKIARVIPLFKSGNTKEFSNYRPISLLLQFSKILEKIYHSRLMAFIYSN